MTGPDNPSTGGPGPPPRFQELPEELVEDVVEQVVQQLPDDVQDRADSAPMGVILIGIMVLAALGVLWSLLKRVILLAVLFAAAGVVAFVWYGNR